MTDREILDTLNRFYDMEFGRLKLLREGGCKAYCVWSKRKKFFLKIIPPAFFCTVKQSLNILLYLEENQFPAPYVIKTRDGETFIEMDTSDQKSIFVLYHYIEGKEPEEGEDIEQIGALVGRLHSIMQEYPEELPEHNREFFIERYIRILKKKNYDEDKIRQFRQYGDLLWSRVQNLPRGFCHGDLHRGNLLKTAEGKYYLLDFDTACRAFPVYDIMIMCNATNYFDFEEAGGQKSRNIYEKFLEGYSQYCSLEKEEKDAFYDLIAIYHYQLQATIIEIHGLDCVDHEFLDRQLEWLMKWQQLCSGQL